LIRRLLLGSLILCLSCGGASDVPQTEGPDAGTLPADAGAQPDAGTQPDAGAPDASVEPDAGSPDAGVPDAGDAPDAGLEADAGTADAGADAGLPDAGAQPDAGTQPDAGAAVPVRIRLLAGNLSTGNNQNYTGGEGLRIIEGVHPDVAMLQEFNYQSNLTADFQSFADAVCGTTCFFARETIAGNGNIPNGIVSKYPIIDSGRFVDSTVANRGFVWAEIAIPGSKHLWVVSVHLLTATGNHATEGSELVGDFQSLVPAGDYLAIGGDFNSDSRTDAAVTALSALFVTGGPYPADGSGDEDTNASRAKPFDWVLANPALDALDTPVVIGANAFSGGLVVDTRVYTPIADLSPALSTDSGAPSMQHMAIVRDFFVPAP
jgi:endonuclease/exonuclease/phosphatase family metal-dependent hydrolase